MGPAATFLTTKPSLIDNGCHMVLIWLDVVEELGLTTFTLDQPEEVDMAIFFSKAGITQNKQSLVQYVKIHPYSKTLFFILTCCMLLFVWDFACHLFLVFHF